MMQPVDKVEPPLASTPVQIVCGLFVTITVVVSILTLSTTNPSLLDSNPVAIEIDINLADAHELSLLPGVGPVLADRIQENRRRNGPFESVADLDRVRGVGAKTLAGIRPFAVVSLPNDQAFQARLDQEAIKSR